MENQIFEYVNIGVIIIEAFLFYRLINNVLEFKYNKKYSWIPGSIVLFIGLSRYICIEFLPLNNSLVENSSKFLLYLSLFVIAYFFYNNTIFEKLIWPSVYIMILLLSELVIILFFFIFLKIPSEQLFYNLETFFMALIPSKLCAAITIELIVLKKKHKFFLQPFYLKEIGIIFIIDLLMVIGIINIISHKKWFINNFNICITAIMCCLLGISILTVIIIYKLSQKSQEELENQLKLKQIEMENQLNLDMSNVVENLSSLRHDMNNHMSIMKGLIQAKQYDDLLAYFSEIHNDIDHANNFLFVESKALSVLLNSKISKAQQRQIDFQCIVSVQNIKMSDKDMCALLGNVIDNAIEASEKSEDKYIQLLIKEKNNSCIIECENTFKDPPTVKNGRFITSKKDSLFHGIGTENIKSIVEKYHGTIQISYVDLFIVKICIPYTTSI